jgi:hypothetical protein
MYTGILLTLWLSAAPQLNGIGKTEINKLIDIFLSNTKQQGAQAVKLLSRRPTMTRDIIDERLETTEKEATRKRLEALRKRVLIDSIVKILFERSKSMLTFSGQWDDLKQYDREIPDLLLAIVKEEQLPMQIRESALHAVSDLRLTSLLTELEKITDDIL